MEYGIVHIVAKNLLEKLIAYNDPIYLYKL
jgi:hypothetical protein